MDEFTPRAPAAQSRLDSMEEKDLGFYCLDELPEDMILGGDKQINDRNQISFFLTPCNYIHTYTGQDWDTVPEECIWDLEQQKAYLGASKIMILWMTDRFDPEGFGEETIIHEAQIIEERLDLTVPGLAV